MCVLVGISFLSYLDREFPVHLVFISMHSEIKHDDFFHKHGDTPMGLP
jgi:hypothetical protein